VLDRLFPPSEPSRDEWHGNPRIVRAGPSHGSPPGGVCRFRTSARGRAALLDTLIRTRTANLAYPGVNLWRCCARCFQDLRAGRVVSGGSTLTMQAARLWSQSPNGAVESDRDRSGVTAGVAFLQARNSGHLADAGAVWRQPGGRARGVVGMVRRLGPEPGRGPIGAPGGNSRDGPRHCGRIAISTRLALSWTAFSPRTRRHSTSRLPMPEPRAPGCAGLIGPARVTTTLDLTVAVRAGAAGVRSTAKVPERASVALLVVDAGTRQIAGRFRWRGHDEARAWGTGPYPRDTVPRVGDEAVYLCDAFEAGIADLRRVWRICRATRHLTHRRNFDRGFAARDRPRRYADRLNLPRWLCWIRSTGPIRGAAEVGGRCTPFAVRRGALFAVGFGRCGDHVAGPDRSVRGVGHRWTAGGRWLSRNRWHGVGLSCGIGQYRRSLRC